MLISLLNSTPSTLEKFLLSGETVIFARLVQLEKAELPICVTLSGMVISVRLLQSRKAESPIFVKAFESCTFESDVQLSKA